MRQGNQSDRAITDRVIRAREEAGITKTDLAARLGMTKQGYYHYEKYQSPFSVQQLLDLERILGHSLEYFLGRDTPLSDRETWVLAMYREAEDKGLAELVENLLQAIAGTPR